MGSEPPYFPTIGERVRGVAKGLLVAVGLRRARRADGSLAPRRTRRLLGILSAAFTFWLLGSVIAVVPAGSVGVPVTLGHAGTGLDQGIHLTWPFTEVKPISIRTTAYTMAATSGEGDRGSQDDSVQVLGADGASGTVDSTVLFRVEENRASQVYVTLGQDFIRTLIRPSARSCIRSVFTELAMVDAATTGWQDIEDEVTRCMGDKLDGRGILLEDFQLREVRLEDTLQRAVTAKTAAEQNAERQRFELAIAEAKAEITRVDAKATADSQQILACGGVETEALDPRGNTYIEVVPNPVEDCSQAQLTPQYLQWTYIQALQGLVDSPNNSTIILPFDQNLTPLLNIGGDTAPPASVDTSVDSTPPATTPADGTASGDAATKLIAPGN